MQQVKAMTLVIPCCLKSNIILCDSFDRDNKLHFGEQKESAGSKILLAGAPLITSYVWPRSLLTR